ncbi:hypothetical protein GeomeDRAFT_2932 [Geobacter metallireducens RCH3]|nr:hypothetical protein GeomeDRAFT_2932 [Geobacter metallireducens RCH3]
MPFFPLAVRIFLFIHPGQDIFGFVPDNRYIGSSINRSSGNVELDTPAIDLSNKVVKDYPSRITVISRQRSAVAQRRNKPKVIIRKGNIRHQLFNKDVFLRNNSNPSSLALHKTGSFQIPEVCICIIPECARSILMLHTSGIIAILVETPLVLRFTACSAESQYLVNDFNRWRFCGGKLDIQRHFLKVQPAFTGPTFQFQQHRQGMT